MKARVKKTGEEIEVTCIKGIYVDENGNSYNLKELGFGHEEDKHWQEVRERAAIAAMQGLLSNSRRIFAYYQDCAEMAINYANTLVEQLIEK